MTTSYWDLFWPLFGLAFTGFTVLALFCWFAVHLIRHTEDGDWSVSPLGLCVLTAAIVAVVVAGTGFTVILQATGWA